MITYSTTSDHAKRAALLNSILGACSLVKNPSPALSAAAGAATAEMNHLRRNAGTSRQSRTAAA